MLKERVQEEALQGGLAPQGVKVTQDSQVPPQGDEIHIWGESNEVPMVPPEMINGDIGEALLT